MAALVGYTLRACLPGRRWVGIALPCVASVLFGLLTHALDGPAEDEFAQVASNALLALVLPVTCLVVGDAVLGAEIRSGTFAFTWLSPVPTWKITVGRWIGGSVIACVTLAGSFALAAVVAGASGSAPGIALATAFGAGAYVALFIAIGSMVRRAAVWSLAFVFLVERLLGAALSGIAQLSPSWVARAAFVDLVDAPADLVRSGVPHGGAALVRLLLITTVGLVLASRRLGRLRLSGSAD